MSKSVVAVATAVLTWGLSVSTLALQSSVVTTERNDAPIQTTAGTAMSLDAQSALVKQYCTGCHSDSAKAGGLTLASFDPARVDQNAPVAEKMIRKLRAGLMPPPAARRPDAEAVKAFVTALETHIDEAAAKQPNPGRRTFQRLNRAEYVRAIRDLLALDADVDAFLPSDTISSGFDNIADVQSFSATLMTGYLRAASQISRLAVGDPHATPTPTTYNIPRTQGQMRHVEGTPAGTRGGLSVVHVFPADGDYTFKLTFFTGGTGELYGATTISSTDKGEQIEISVNGERRAVFTLDAWRMHESLDGLSLTTPAIRVNAGPQRVAAAFIERYAGPVDDLIAPVDYSFADPRVGIVYGLTALPHLRELTITGPQKVFGVSDTPSRRKIFTCRPDRATAEMSCATSIIRRLASQAYREPVSASDFEILMGLYRQSRKTNDFESAIRLTLQGILANPRFLFRVEELPAALKAGQAYRISDLDLASRLSFFLWAGGPDADLLKAAGAGTLRNPGVLEKQVRRMLADPRSEALATRFAGQWLRLQDVDKISPEVLLFPQYDLTLARSFVRETELFFDSLVREDRNLLDLLTADYSFVNERVARHYGIANVLGDQFRRVPLPPERRGILGHGSVLMQTSVANRTSPVQRGKWIMEVLLGTPPPPPPPNVPLFEETNAVSGGRVLSVRERMEQHRANPTCNSCHRVIDPPGLALENFDVTGYWRNTDNGAPINPAGQLYDGSSIEGLAGLNAGLLKHADIIVLNFTQNLMTYAIGRRVEYYDMPSVRAIVREAASHDNRVSSFVLGVVNSPAFQMTKAPESLTEANVDSSSKQRHD